MTHRWQWEAGMPWALSSHILTSRVPLLRWPIAPGSPWLSLPPFHPSWSWWILAAEGKRWVSTGAHLPEGGPRQVRAFPHKAAVVSSQNTHLKLPGLSRCVFYTDVGWWTPDHCPLSVFIASITQTLRDMLKKNLQVEGKGWLHCPLCITNHVAKPLKAKLAK